MDPSEDLTLGFQVGEEAADDTEYAILTHNGITLRVERNDWTLADDKYTVAYKDIASTQMNDVVTIDFYDGNDNLLANLSASSSVRAHAVSVLESDASDTVKTKYMDMLNYGAAAQAHFGYNTENPANAGLEAYQHYATKTVTTKNDQYKGPGYSSTTLEMESALQLNLLFNKAVVKKSMIAKITITDESGKVDKEYELDGSSFKSHTNNRWRIEIPGLSPEDYDHLIKCEIYSGSTLMASATDSVGSYLSRAIKGGGGALYEKTMAYCQSAKAVSRIQ